MLGQSFLIRFYHSEPGDLGIQNTHWGGFLSDAKTWARQRLDSLRMAERAGDRSVPAKFDIVDPATNQIIYCLDDPA